MFIHQLSPADPQQLDAIGREGRAGQACVFQQHHEVPEDPDWWGRTKAEEGVELFK